jgi:inward rectifier potassium channel
LIRKRKTLNKINGDEFQDLGFGAKVASQRQRLINRDGSFNVIRTGQSFLERFSPYHYLVSISWLKFNTFVVAAYLVINILFAFIYLAFGINNLNSQHTYFFHDFLNSFFFSLQTFTTVGYGRLNPTSDVESFIAGIESLSGLMGFALATGLLYGRFSRPNAKIIFSNNAIIAPYKDITAFEFRIANARDNQLIEADIQVMLSMKDKTKGREAKRVFHNLSLERQKVTFFSLTWTVVHPIDKESPLYGLSAGELKESDAEFLILFKAFDDTFSQTVHSRSSYKYDEIIWNAAFRSVYLDAKSGVSTIDMRIIHEIDKLKD